MNSADAQVIAMANRPRERMECMDRMDWQSCHGKATQKEEAVRANILARLLCLAFAIEAVLLLVSVGFLLVVL